jgi:hypothetical protein
VIKEALHAGVPDILLEVFINLGVTKGCYLDVSRYLIVENLYRPVFTNPRYSPVPFASASWIMIDLYQRHTIVFEKGGKFKVSWFLSFSRNL